MQLKQLVPDPLGILAKVPDPLGIMSKDLPGTRGKSGLTPPEIPNMPRLPFGKTVSDFVGERKEYEKTHSPNRVPPEMQSKDIPHGEYSY